MRSTRLGTLVNHMIGCVLALCAMLQCAGQEPKEKAPVEEVYIFGKQLQQLLETDPDVVILVGEQARQYLENSKESERKGSPAVQAQQCRIRGELSDDTANLSLEITARSERAGRNPLPLGLSEAFLIEASIDGRSPILIRDSQGWVALVEGLGQHTIMLKVQFPFAGSKNLPALVSAIPEAPITTLELRAARAVSDVRLAPSAPLTLRPVADSRAHIEAALGPRNRLDLRWRWSEGQSREPAPVIRAGSDVVATVEPGVVQIKTELRFEVRRGSLQTCELRIGADERVQDLRTSEGLAVEWHPRIENGEQIITLQFPEPVTSNAEFLINSEVPWSGNSRTIRGITLVGAQSHRSRVALRCAPDLDLAVTDSVNARRVETLSSALLRSTRNEAVFEAFAQPFQLKLSLKPRQSGTTVRTTALLSFDGEQAMVFERWQFSVHGGKVSYVDFKLPSGFETNHFVFSDAIQSVREETGENGRLARVFLKGTPDSFELRLRATVPLVVARNLAKLDVPGPLDSQSELSRLFLADSKDFTLDATPDLAPLDDPLDPSLTSERNETSGAVRGFQTRSLLDRVSFRVSSAIPNVRYQSTAEIKLDMDAATVTQSFEYSVQGSGVRQLRLSVPESARQWLKVESAPGRIASTGMEGELIVRLEGELPDPLRLRISYRLAMDRSNSPGEQRSLYLPLLRPLDSSCDVTELVIAAPPSVGVEVQGDEWRPVARASLTTTASFPAARLALRNLGQADGIALNVSRISTLPQPVMVVDRALLETTVGPGGEWYSRIRCVVSSAALTKLRLRVPDRGRITQVRWDGSPVLFRPVTETGVIELMDSLEGSFPSVLDIESESVPKGKFGWWESTTWIAPSPLGDVSWGRIYWQLTLPRGLALLRGPTTYSDENHLCLSGATVRLEPLHGQESLVEWLTGTATASSSPRNGCNFLFSRLVSIEPMSVFWMSRPLLVLFSSGVVMLLGVVLFASPVRGRAWLSFALFVGIGALVVLEPTAAVEWARSAILGTVLVVIAGTSLAWLSRKRLPKRTVFPEPGMLAKAQESSVRSSSDFAKGQGALGANPSPAPPTAAVQRLVARSSNVR